MAQKVLTTIEEIKAYSDPYRIKIMNTFQKMGRPATVKEIADELGEVAAKVHYHVKKLEKVGLVELVETKEINGIIAKYYEAFSGDIRIKHEGMEDHIKQVFASETIALLSGLYDENKSRFLKYANRMDVSPFANLINNTLYLTQEEAEQFIDYIKSFAEAHSKKVRQKDIQAYEFFATIVKEMPKEKDSNS
ncbi:helix-turn-helix domain-containing protein [Paenibacillus sediminis]|uniref:DNA-binding Lrp family transcriptional regulator n=1 Tax=Paenibacillus sediminis TaxID=664909 RepID=A0ABS4H192_9BACL|nr:helix-turn-helix domain-containing protein [Paenibacillus sediminis]MBP1936301.1 DNA-binding Lrp family transcriptional regulator [Paenibacillus sediminis]